jgi:electron transport complex protein RnfC
LNNINNTQYIDALKDLCVNKCVQCGLCSYVCPSRIELTEKVGKAKDLYFKMSRK